VVPIYALDPAQMDVFATVGGVLLRAATKSQKGQDNQEGKLTITINRPYPRVSVVRPVVGLGLVALLAAISISLSRGTPTSELGSLEAPTGRPPVLDSGHHLAPLPTTSGLVVDPTTMKIYRS
jgi:hypothetical protein